MSDASAAPGLPDASKATRAGAHIEREMIPIIVLQRDVVDVGQQARVDYWSALMAMLSGKMAADIGDSALDVLTTLHKMAGVALAESRRKRAH